MKNTELHLLYPVCHRSKLKSCRKMGLLPVSRMASGEYEKAQEDKLKALASALGVTMEDLLEN